MIKSVLMCALAILPAFAEVNVYKNFTLIDGNGKAPVANAAMIVDNGRIKWVGTSANLKAPAGSNTIDLTGKFVMPGIINLHGHLGNVVDLTQDPKNFTRANVEKNLKTYATYGVTSMLSMGSDQELVFQMRAEQRSRRPTTTRIFTAGRGFTGLGGYPTTVPGMKGVPYEVTNATEIAKDVNELAGKKADIVKIWVDDHLGRERKIPIDLSASIISEAHKHNLKVAAHIFYLEDARQLVDHGLDGLAHSVRDKPIDQAMIDLMKKKGAWQAAATLAREYSMFAFANAPAFLNDPFFTRSVSPSVVETLKSPAYQQKIASDHDFAKYPVFFETAKKNLKRLADAGVKYGFGTDTGPPARFPGFFEQLEMQLMVDAGLTPMQVIIAATRSSAEFLGVTKDLGTIEPGKWADFIVLGKSPLADIKNTRSLESVFIAGNRAN
jgi:imidazolonepropionase-like amidohydrolase